ncbi:hypothetical protein NDR87_19415 [Nocardia sp. CDC159]|uniref:Lipoprotein n=1 Tax=Nocardia pulmonis TaxID=2951408 RepID=A0A9X2IY91_9NOCA|nr:MULTISPECIES: hypothetical protein [Nocardia]MCM6776138.1 hypothetical protein [Nocardia pulmonis]MCM6788535.1 hypothetical protein [Nocardia sp. CDC159]
MNKLGQGLLSALVAAALAATAACGSDDGDGAPTDPVVDLAGLDVGNNPTEPKEYTKPTSLEMAKLVEAMRLGNALPLPSDIDPAAKYAIQTPGNVYTFISFDSEAIARHSDADTKQLDAQIKGLVCGFVSSGRTDTTKSLAVDLDNVVMLFDSEDSARTAADLLAQADFAAKPSYAPDMTKTPVALGKYPAAHGQITPAFPGGFRSWYATGKYVIFTYIYDYVMSATEEQDVPKLVARAEKSIDTISAALRGFTPTPPDRLMTADVDPDRVLGRTLRTVVVDNSQRGNPGVYDRRGGLQISLSPDTSAQLFEAAGVDRVAWMGGYLYRARDAAGARKIVQEMAAPSRKLTRVEPPKNLPFAQCLGLRVPTLTAVNYYCAVSHGRYAAWLYANQLRDVHQRTSAQYALLVNSEGGR